MDTDSKIKTGWIVVGVAFGATVLIIATVQPDIDDVEGCETMVVVPEGHQCEKILDDNDTAGALGAVFCVLPGMVGSVLLGLGYSARKNESVSISTIPDLYDAGSTNICRPTYPTVKFIRCRFNTETTANEERELRSEGRLMEAALEAEQAGEYSFAGELRKQAEDKLRNSHQPQSNNEDRYLVFLTTALADGFLSMEEENLLETKRNELGISWDVHVNMLTTAGYSHEKLKLLQNAKSMEDSGRLLESAGLYEAAGNLDRAQMLRMKAKMIDSSQSNITYNISDSAVSGNIGSNIFDDKN